VPFESRSESWRLPDELRRRGAPRRISERITRPRWTPAATPHEGSALAWTRRQSHTALILQQAANEARERQQTTDPRPEGAARKALEIPASLVAARATDPAAAPPYHGNGLQERGPRGFRPFRGDVARARHGASPPWGAPESAPENPRESLTSCRATTAKRAHLGRRPCKWP
jgi:hypothetical protein